ncbi:MAG: ABC transporter permease [Acidimicrobiales bacterium]|nr:ABC transporter permease [Acidimicrobiales bacterium]RZV44869.1 MAG: ABC transporter permease [Acidimicrobiales bacterium]
MSGTVAEPKGATKRTLQGLSGLVYFFFYAPIILLVIFSFSDNRNVGVWGGFTLDWYREFGESSGTQDALWNSVQIGLVSTAVSVVLGTLAALALERFTFRGKQVFDALLYLPIIIPDVTMAVMLLLFFAQIAEWFGITKGFATITLSHIAFSISFVSIVVRARLAGMDDKLEEAAMDLYATRWMAFRHVTLPLIMPGILGGALLAMTLSLDDVVITQFVTGPGWNTLPVFVFGLIRRGVTPLINAVSVVMLVASMGLVALSLITDRARSSDSAT